MSGPLYRLINTQTLPVSTTYLMLGMVIEVSATLVATTQSLVPSGGGSNTYRKIESMYMYEGVTKKLLVNWPNILLKTFKYGSFNPSRHI